MNLSGIAVGAYANYYNLGNEEIAVIQDDLDLPVGQLRIRKKGSAGGHNGIKSIQEHLGTDEFPRFKIGISHPGRNGKAVVSHVLKAFAGEEKAAIEEAVKKMADALERWIKEDIDAVMNEYNKKPAKPKKEKAPKAEEGAEVKAEVKTEETTKVAE
jgi:PTH1 family peptidyl-tRNA hydrolase